MPNMLGIVTDILNDGTVLVKNQNTPHVKNVHITIDLA